ncbi:MAG: MBL fold metallo-hydrolase [Candidatus Spechtbacterales bacterium]|nr:MBL fold metallo-hydrolase [Candidatus Spechtbacterales bacterium]
MVITWYGQSCFKIQSGSTTVITDPFKKTIGLNPPTLEAQLVLVTHDHDDHNNAKTIKGDPFVIDGPGEYEYKGIRVRGIRSFHDNKNGEEKGLNTIYNMRLEDMNICHLGDLGQEQLEEEQLENLGEVDMLFVPVGGKFTIGAEKAVAVVNQIEPRLVIPMHYKVKGLKVQLGKVDEFLKEIGKKDLKLEEKLTIKKKDLPDPEEKMEVFAFKL